MAVEYYPCGSTARAGGSTAPAVVPPCCPIAVVFLLATAALVVVPLLGAVVPLGAGREDNSWIFSLL